MESYITNNYYDIRNNLELNWDQIDFDYLIRDEQLILGKDEKYAKIANSNQIKD